jgi:magnesium transporter
MDPERSLLEGFLNSHPRDAARRLEVAPPDAVAALLTPLAPHAVARLAAHLPPVTCAAWLGALPHEQAAAVLGALPTATATAALHRLPRAVTETLLPQLEPHVRAAVRRAMGFAEHAVGRLADPFVLALPGDITVAEARERVRREPERVERYLYVLAEDARLAGVLSLKLLVTGDPEDRVLALATTRVASLTAESPARETAGSALWAHYDLLPVVGRDNGFIGALSWRTLHEWVGQGNQAQPRSLPASLLELWELFGLAGLGVMTHVASAAAASLEHKPGATQDADGAPARE